MSFENEKGRTSHSECYFPKVEVKDYKAETDGRNFFDQPIYNNIKTSENIRKIVTGQGNDYTKEDSKTIAIALSKQQPLDADPRAIQQINFTANLDTAGNTLFFTIEEAKETVLDFSQGTVRVL